MSSTTDRVTEFLGGIKRRRRVLVTPEGVPLEMQIAGSGERLAAFGIDFAILLGSVLIMSLMLGLVLGSGSGAAILQTLIQFAAFLVRTFYFVHFELAWQGRTPGKKAAGLRVINRNGGELTPSAVIARNLIREAEFFLPLSLALTLDADAGFGRQMACLGWALVVASLPLWNKDRLRAGDLIAGTQVIAMPKRLLSHDLTQPALVRTPQAFSFSQEQLSRYGAFELQILEELLRRPDTWETQRLLEDVCKRICRKIQWQTPITISKTRQFLTEFYTAERAELEQGKLFGRLREDKHARP